MAYIIAEPCIGTKDTACVDVCPVDCIHPAKGRTYDDGRPTFDEVPQLYIDPTECIDCGACVPVCPVTAIFPLDDLPEKWHTYIEINKNYVDGGKFQPDKYQKVSDPQRPILQPDPIPQPAPEPAPEPAPPAPQSDSNLKAQHLARMNTLREIIYENVRGGELYEKLDRNWVQCFACGHCCKIPDGQPGVCKVRYNRDGTLFVPWGYVGGVQCDPVEKKPFFHAHPGALAYSFGMLGCDLHCGYCQNWVTSQALRDPAAAVGPMRVAPAELVLDAIRQRGRVIVSTYNEPLITIEWARATGLVTGFVSNGNGTPQVLEYLRPWVDLYKVDLKSFDDRHYRQLGGRLQPILDTVRQLHEMGFWLEIVTLVIPGFNDSSDELTRLAEFLAGVSSDIPWHVTAFHKDYKMTDPENTSAETLVRAAEIGRKAGLRYVYAGNLPGQVGDLENTRCPNCKTLLIERFGYLILGYHLTPNGSCPSCGRSIPGKWASAFQGQITARPFVPRTRTRSDLLVLNS